MLDVECGVVVGVGIDIGSIVLLVVGLDVDVDDCN